MRSARIVLVPALVVLALAAGSTALLFLTDVPLSLVYALWVAPLAVLIPHASRSGQPAYDLRTAAAALVLPTVAGVWVVWLVVIRAH